MADAGAQSRGERSRPDLTIMREVASMMTDRLVGTAVSLGQDGSRLTATITSVDVEPADTTMSAQVEAGLDAWADMNDAALRSLDRIDPLAAGLRMFGAAVSGFEKVLDAGPVNPIEGVAKIAKRLRLEMASARHPSWKATSVELRCAELKASFDVATTHICAADVAVVARLDETDVAASIELSGWGAHDIRIVGSEAFVVRRVGVFSVWLPVDVELTADHIVVGVSTVRVGRWRVDLPARVARSWRRSRLGIAGPLDLASVAIDDGVVSVTAIADEVKEPVTAAQVSALLSTLRSGATDVRVDRVSVR